MSKRFWNDSEFGTGPRVPMDREQRARFRAMLKLQRRPSRLTIAAAVVGSVLVEMLEEDGRCDPALETIAARAAVSLATVKRALVKLRAFGFLTWVRRLVRDAGSAWRAAQTSNAYALYLPVSEANFAPQVSLTRKKKGALEESSGWAAQVKRATAKLNGINPEAYITDIISRIDEHPALEIDKLLPWHWHAWPKPHHSAANG